MNILDHKGERFIVKDRGPEHKFKGISIHTLRRKYGADICIRTPQGELLFLEYIEPITFEDIPK